MVVITNNHHRQRGVAKRPDVVLSGSVLSDIDEVWRMASLFKEPLRGNALLTAGLCVNYDGHAAPDRMALLT